MKSSLKIKILSLFILFFVVVFLGIIKGSVHLSLSELLRPENRSILHLRFLRIFLAIIAGSGLAVAGIALQAILRNPLAEPYLLGTSSGASLGAILAIVVGFSINYLPLAAFLGAILTTVLVYWVAKQGNKVPVQSLILAGVVVSVAFSGMIVFLVSFYGDKALHGLLWWLWGSLQVYDFKLLCVVSVTVILGILAIFALSQDLNAISIGEEEAIHLGINTDTIKKLLFLITSLITASLVSICGIIGFVGLIIPHIMRFVVGPNHRILIPSTCLSAAIFMVLCDLLSRTLFVPFEIPIGVITAAVGSPIFIALLKTKQKIK